MSGSGLYSSTFQLEEGTFCCIPWVVTLSFSDKHGSG